jgi:hypothetical protein
MDGLITGLQGEGGYAILLGIVVVSVLAMAREWIKSQQLVHKEGIERERRNADAYRDTTERMTDVVDGNTKAIVTMTATLGPMAETLNRIDRHLLQSERPRRGGQSDA